MTERTLTLHSGVSNPRSRYIAITTACKRWLSVRAYGLFTSTLFRAGTPPRTLRSRFERFSHVSREAMQKNLCRCGTHVRIVRAIQRAAAQTA